MGVLYYEVSDYLGNLARHSLMQRQHLFARFEGEQLDEALATSMTFDLRTVDAYGLFDAQHRPLSGPIQTIPAGLPLDGQIHALSTCIDSDDPNLPQDSCDAVATHTNDGRWLVLVRDNGSLFAVTRIILHALFWGVSLTIIPGIAGWHLLRRRPLQRIRSIQASAEAIVAGDLTYRLPLSNRRDELDMLAAIARSGDGSFLAVLKTFGNRQPLGMLSFPQPGVTLALDFPNRGARIQKLFERLDAIVGEARGRLYPAKDARMPRDLFEAGYPRLAEFMKYRDPGISSGFSRRLLGS